MGKRTIEELLEMPTTKNLLAVDPGTRASGWALFRDGVLAECGTLTASRLGLMGWKIQRWFLDRPGLGPIDLAIERAPVTSRRDHPADLFMPGVAAGLWIMRWQVYRSDGSKAPEPILVPVAEWRKAVLGHRRNWPIADAKAVALLRAGHEWNIRGVTPQAPESRLADAGEATCIGLCVIEAQK